MRHRRSAARSDRSGGAHRDSEQTAIPGRHRSESCQAQSDQNNAQTYPEGERQIAKTPEQPQRQADRSQQLT